MTEETSAPDQAQKPTKPQSGLIPFAPSDRLALYKSYMPFYRNGGLFVPTPKQAALGEDVFVLIKFPDAGSERVPAAGKVVWINRSGSSAKPAGLGIQFSDAPENLAVKSEIERIVAGMPSDIQTYTM